MFDKCVQHVLLISFDSAKVAPYNLGVLNLGIFHFQAFFGGLGWGDTLCPEVTLEYRNYGDLSQ